LTETILDKGNSSEDQELICTNKINEKWCYQL